MGLNGDAFGISTTVGAAGGVLDVSGDINNIGTGSATVAAKDPSFTIDLGNLTVTAGDLTITIGGKDFTITGLTKGATAGAIANAANGKTVTTVSYTHLDVYKRQERWCQ